MFSLKTANPLFGKQGGWSRECLGLAFIRAFFSLFLLTEVVTLLFFFFICFFSVSNSQKQYN